MQLWRSVQGAVWRADQQVVERPGQVPQLSQMSRGELGEPSLAKCGQPDPDDPAVSIVWNSFDQACSGGAVDKLDRAVVPLQQVARQLSHSWRLISRMAFDGYEQLMLDVREPCGARLVLAPALEPAQACPEGEELLEVLPAQRRHSGSLPRRPHGCAGLRSGGATGADAPQREHLLGVPLLGQQLLPARIRSNSVMSPSS